MLTSYGVRAAVSVQCEPSCSCSKYCVIILHRYFDKQASKQANKQTN